jgi:hypothetical protein
VPEPAEVNNSLRLAKGSGTTTLTWNHLPGPFNVYRGSKDPTTAWSYNRPA